MIKSKSKLYTFHGLRREHASIPVGMAVVVAESMEEAFENANAALSGQMVFLRATIPVEDILKVSKNIPSVTPLPKKLEKVDNVITTPLTKEQSLESMAKYLEDNGYKVKKV